MIGILESQIVPIQGTDYHYSYWGNYDGISAPPFMDEILVSYDELVKTRPDYVRYLFSGALYSHQRYEDMLATMDRAALMTDESEEQVAGWAVGKSPNTSDIEIAYLVCPECSGHGVGTALAGQFVKSLIEDGRYNTCVAIVHTDNSASKKVMDKVKSTYRGKCSFDWFAKDWVYTINLHRN